MAHSNSPLDLGVLPIGKLLGQYAVPAIIAMTASSLYNMVDSIFIGHGVGALAISGLALTFPFMNLSAAFGAMVGVGASTLISVKLGQKDYESAQQIFGNRMESHYETQENLRYDCSNRLHIGACDWLQRYASRGRNEVGFCNHRAVR